MKKELLHIESKDILLDKTFQTRKRDSRVIESVRTSGLMMPVSVWEADGRYVLIDGYSMIGGVDGTIPVYVVRGDIVDAMSFRFRRNMALRNVSAVEVSNGLKGLKERGTTKDEIFSRFLDKIGYGKIPDAQEILDRTANLPEGFKELLDRKMANYKICTILSGLSKSVLNILYEILSEHDISHSNLRQVTELVFIISQKNSEEETVQKLLNVRKLAASRCMLMHLLDREARPWLWSINDELEKLDMTLREAGNFRLRWDRTLENPEITLEIKASGSFGKIDDEKMNMINKIMDRAVELLSKGNQHSDE